jgi:hypothetical protein
MKISCYSSFHEKMRADIAKRYPWIGFDSIELYVDVVKDAPIWLYPVIYGPEEYR